MSGSIKVLGAKLLSCNTNCERQTWIIKSVWRGSGWELCRVPQCQQLHLHPPLPPVCWEHQPEGDRTEGTCWLSRLLRAPFPTCQFPGQSSGARPTDAHLPGTPQPCFGLLCCTLGLLPSPQDSSSPHPRAWPLGGDRGISLATPPPPSLFPRLQGVCRMGQDLDGLVGC